MVIYGAFDARCVLLLLVLFFVLIVSSRHSYHPTIVINQTPLLLLLIIYREWVAFLACRSIECFAGFSTGLQGSDLRICCDFANTLQFFATISVDNSVVVDLGLDLVRAKRRKFRMTLAVWVSSLLCQKTHRIICLNFLFTWLSQLLFDFWVTCTFLLHGSCDISAIWTVLGHHWICVQMLQIIFIIFLH